MHSERLSHAFAFSSQLHKDQKRDPSDIPYLSHLLSVAGLVLEHGGNEDQVIAALLHDALEDQSSKYPGGPDALRAEFKRSFGENVLIMVEELTDTDQSPKPEWRERKETYLAHLQNASQEVLLISCADKLHNARSILIDFRDLGDEVWHRFTGKKEGTLWYYQSLAAIFRKNAIGFDSLVSEFERTINQLMSLSGESPA